MDWLWGAALLPFLMCGVMCLGGIALAALGLRRGAAASRPGCPGRADAGVGAEEERVTS